MHYEALKRLAEIHREELDGDAARARLAALARASGDDEHGARLQRIGEQVAAVEVRLRRVAQLALQMAGQGRRRAVEAVRMARFMDVHSGFMGVTAAQLREAHERDLAIEAQEGVHFERAWLDPESGKVFCLSTGPTKEAVMRIHERAGHPTGEVYEINTEVA